MWYLKHALVNENPIVPPEQLEALPIYEDAMNFVRISEYQKVPPAFLEPNQQLHPLPQGNSILSQKKGSACLTVMIQSSYWTPSSHPMSSEPFYLRPSCTGNKENLINPYEWKEPSYEEIRCFIDLILWTSLVQLPKGRCYFTDSKIFHLPYFKQHSSHNRFKE